MFIAIKGNKSSLKIVIFLKFGYDKKVKETLKCMRNSRDLVKVVVKSKGLLYPRKP